MLKKRRKERTIRQSIMILGLFIIFFIGIIISYYSIMKVEKVSMEKTEKEILGLVYQEQNWISDYISTSKIVGDNLVKNIETIRLSDGIENKRELVEEMIKKILMDYPDIIGIAVAYEANAFDGKDKEFIGIDRYGDHGRFMPYIAKSNGDIIIDSLIDIETSQWYLEPKNTKNTVVTQPYEYLVNDKNVKMITIAVPIIDKGKFMGIVGIDTPIDIIQETINEILLIDESESIVIINSKGTVIASKNILPNFSGEDILDDEIYNSLDLFFYLNNLKTAAPELKIKREVVEIIAPLNINGIDKPLGMIYTLPLKVIRVEVKNLLLNMIFVVSLVMVFSIMLFWISTGKVTKSITEIIDKMNDFDIDNLPKIDDVDIDTELVETNILLNTYKNIIGVLHQNAKERNQSNWLLYGQTELNELIQGQTILKNLCDDLIATITKKLNGQIGALYLVEKSKFKDKISYNLFSSYAYTHRKGFKNRYYKGEGLVGQVALEGNLILVKDIPEEFLLIDGGIGKGEPRELIVMPCEYNGEIMAILEIGTITSFTNIQLEYLKQIGDNIAIALSSLISYDEMKEVLIKLEEQTEELRVQQEELRVNNEELYEKTKKLQESRSKLESQQQELSLKNDELEINSDILKEQKLKLEAQNNELIESKSKIAEKANELKKANEYKSEFLANMSHELRTPLNSILILSELIKSNKNDNLSDKELEFASTINDSGKDLLELINDILDLSKVEAGKVELNIEKMYLDDFVEEIERLFMELANNKKIEFKSIFSENLPEYVLTDSKKVKQIIKNLLSNAFKFTDKGSVTLSLRSFDEKILAIEVIDTGIGIESDKQIDIFEAFRQEDGTTSRKYGGTGLGLSISKEYARLLQGELNLESSKGIGSKFSLHIPYIIENVKIENDDLELEQSDDFEKNNEHIGEEKIDFQNRNIENNSIKEIQMNKQTVLNKDEIRVLVVEDNDIQRHSIVEFLSERHFNWDIYESENMEKTLKLLESKVFNCLVLDLALEDDINNIEFLKTIKENCSETPIVVYTGQDISNAEEVEMKKLVESIVIKGNKSIDRLLEELDFVISKKDKNTEDYMEKPKSDECIFQGEKILIVDDDMRNVFALTSVLEQRGLNIIAAGNGIEGLEKLEANDNIELVLMDIMMPEMNGYEAIEEIRANNKYKDLPIIALTAKAMKEDRIKCIDVGANEYLSKPFDIDKLIAVLKVWLNK